jgi:hypothetical protein
MTRPHAIVLFERLYLGAWLIGLAATLLSWQATYATLMRTPEVAEVGPVFLYATTAIRVIAPLVLWYLIARRGSVVGKWLVLAFFGVTAAGVLIATLRGAFPGSLGTVLGYVAFVLQFAAVLMLFRADAARWFAADRKEAA